MGYLGCLFAWMHPVRHLGHRAQRAITPRPIRRMLRAKNVIVHPVGSVERAAFRSVDRAITPKRRRRRKQAPAPPLLPVEGLEELSALLNQLHSNNRSMADAIFDAQMAKASPEQRARWLPVIEAQRAGARVEFSPQGHVTGWWVGDVFHPIDRPHETHETWRLD